MGAGHGAGAGMKLLPSMGSFDGAPERGATKDWVVVVGEIGFVGDWQCWILHNFLGFERARISLPDGETAPKLP